MQKKINLKLVLLALLFFTFSTFIFIINAKFQEFRKSLSSIDNIFIGYPRSEILYRLGTPKYLVDDKDVDKFGGQRVLYIADPDELPIGKTINDYSIWVYELAHHRLEVLFDKRNNVISLIIFGDSKHNSHWGPIAGINFDDDELTILKLGEPTNISISGVTKTIEYSDIGLSFHLTMGRAYMVTLEQPSKGLAPTFQRFIFSLLK